MKNKLFGLTLLIAAAGPFLSISSAREITTAAVTDCTTFGDATSAGTLAAALAAKPGIIDFECTGTVTVPEIILDFNVIINGQSGVVLDGGKRNRVISVRSGAIVEINHLQISNAYARNSATDRGHGGGIANAGELRLNHVSISGNRADTGGGIYNTALLAVRDVVVRNNSAVFTGGVYNGGQVTGNDLIIKGNVSNTAVLQSYGVFNITGCEITENATNSSPAIGNAETAFMILDQCRLYDNSVSMITNAGSLTVRQSLFRENGENQNEIDNSGKLDIESTTFSDNRDIGATIDNSGLATLTNVTLSGNRFSAIRNSGLMYVYSSTITGQTFFPDLPDYLVENTGELRLANSIINRENAIAECGGTSPIASDGYNLHTDGSCNATHLSDIAFGDTLLGALEDNGGFGRTHLLLNGSDAIDNGNCDAGAVTTDQRGIERPQGIECDMGAVERKVTVRHPVCGPDIKDPDGDGWGWENGKSCRMPNKTVPYCVSPDSDPDGDGWGWENGNSCRVKPGVPYCISPDSDPDGDGWGWENGNSCRVKNSPVYCKRPDSDPDGDGWGWENGASCKVRNVTDLGIIND